VVEVVRPLYVIVDDMAVLVFFYVYDDGYSEAATSEASRKGGGVYNVYMVSKPASATLRTEVSPLSDETPSTRPFSS